MLENEIYYNNIENTTASKCAVTIGASPVHIDKVTPTNDMNQTMHNAKVFKVQNRKIQRSDKWKMENPAGKKIRQGS